MDLDFTEDEIHRYSRHILLAEVGGTGQAKLNAARVLVVGAGGLGSPAVLYLAAAGVGTIGIVDDDLVELSNLQRQVAHTTARIGTPKAESAADSPRARSTRRSGSRRTQLRLTPDNALDLVGRYDIVCDGTDNFATRFLVADACVLARRTLVSAAVLRFEGQLSVFKPHAGRPVLPLPVSRTAAARHGAELQRGRRAGRGHRRDGHPAGNRGAEGNPRHRRDAVRPAADLGRAGHAIPHQSNCVPTRLAPPAARTRRSTTCPAMPPAAAPACAI